MGVLQPYTLVRGAWDPAWQRLETLLTPKNGWLKETQHLAPAFADVDLAASLSILYQGWGIPTHIGYNVDLWNHVIPDIVIANEDTGALIFVELESAEKNNVFVPSKTRHYPKWGTRIEAGHSQVVDWAYALELNRLTVASELKIKAATNWEWLLLVGRNYGLDPQEKIRMEWRSNNVKIHGKTTIIMTYDDLHSELLRRKAIATKWA